MNRIVIIGGPRTGKTTLGRELATTLGLPRPWSTDDLIGTCDWSQASEEIATWFDRAGPWIVEGVAAVRGLRKWLRAHASGKPADAIVTLWEPREALSMGQSTMAKGCATVWAQISGEVFVRGTRLVFTVEEARRTVGAAA